MAKVRSDRLSGKSAGEPLTGSPRYRGSEGLRKPWLTAVTLALLLSSGCNLRQWVDNGFKVGPNYSRPPAPVASEWIDYRDPRVKSEEQCLGEWWQGFHDPGLNALIDTAYRQNLTLRVAGARILQARAVRGIAVGNLFPQQQQAFADQRRIKLSQATANPPPEASFQDWRAGFNASWELDLWGRFRRAIEAADAELDATVDNFDDVLVVLLADVASNYVQYRTFEQRLTYARQNVEIQSRAFQLAEDKFKAGATTERDVQQAKQILEQTRALIPQLEIGLRQAGNRLCVLLGMPPTDLATLVGRGEVIPQAGREVAVGIPADLLRRRPDVRRAERQVKAQSARIGIAEADFYPRFSIIGTIGVEAEQFWDLGKTSRSLFGEIGPSVRWDILNYGRILNNVRVQDARFQELAFTYQDRVLNANREVEDGLVSFLRSQEQADRLAASVAAALRTVEITNEQYRQGAVDFTPVFLFESTLTEQQDQLAVARGNIALGLISVYRSLGGGWEMRLTRDAGKGCGPTAAAPGMAPTPLPGVPPQARADSTAATSVPLPAATLGVPTFGLPVHPR